MINRGSEWNRWEPHIHTPETVFNNQFKGNDPWGNYLDGLEKISPRVRVLAITDYYLTDKYEKIVEYKRGGRLPDVDLIFPNVELRLDISAKSGFVNIHLLVCPDDTDHVEQLSRFLSRLTFEAHQDTFSCTANDLTRLGKLCDPNIKDNRKALEHGATQFKVNFSSLKTNYAKSDWAKNNILLAVAGAQSDGTSGVRESADATIRREIESFSHIIFSSSAAQRDFWLGKKKLSPREIRQQYSGLKPCLHGSDSHGFKNLGVPAEERYSWVKGELIFDSLRQACIDPEGRAYVGSEPPVSASPSQVISSVSIVNAPWLKTADIPLNPGLVAIVGARGSGKTALADMIAAGSDSIPLDAWAADENSSASFLTRARPLLADAQITTTWAGSDENTRFLNGKDAQTSCSYPRARYLSQQFVEDLCSSKGVSDGLIEEIERVILESYPWEDRDGAVSFPEFRSIKTSRFQKVREREVNSIADLSDRIANEIEKDKEISNLELAERQKRKTLEGYNFDKGKLVEKVTEAEKAHHKNISEVAERKREVVNDLKASLRALESLQDEVASTRDHLAPENLRAIKEKYERSGLNPEEWDEFLLIYKGNVDSDLSLYISNVKKKITRLEGPEAEIDNQQIPPIAEGMDLNSLTLNVLSAEVGRLEKLFCEDEAVAKNFKALTTRIRKVTAEVKSIVVKLDDAKGAKARWKALQEDRDVAYFRIFEAIISEQNELAKLYAPLMERIENTTGTLKKLGFNVKRVVDIDMWAGFAEDNLLDLRKSGSFNGKGSLKALATNKLKRVWESGTAIEVQQAISSFLNENMKTLFAHAPYASNQKVEYQNWLKQFAHWLYGTEHISVKYEIVYDNTDIRKLSPGTRGIVLLLLYLALDEDDDRPLIIDQPEENLDPKSVNDELVPLFIKAKSKRQVIMVTHNANLVINTDADQIIIAEVGAQQVGELPPITYIAGGLENKDIRRGVCDILEGGDRAFKERARRLRVRLER
ncbi:TrlF family AAA-like ATPase [Shewanella sp. 30m-9]